MKTDEVLRNKPETISIKISTCQGNIRLNESTILLFNSVQSFKEIAGEISWQTNPKIRRKHLVYIRGAGARDITENIDTDVDVDEVGFLINTNPDEIQLSTNEIFTAQNCGVNQLTPINKFTRKRSKWDHSTFYPKKYQNFHRCRLNAFVVERHAIRTFEKNEKAKTPSQRLLESLASHFNFSIQYKWSNNRTNESSTRFDLLTTVTVLVREGGYFVTSVALRCETYSLLVPPGDPYTQLEKMFSMFDWEVWVAIIATLVSFLLFIQIINRMSTRIQNFVYGSGVTTPTLNLFDIFLNGGQRIFPTRSFARFVLLMIIIWSLQIRTCYQSMLYSYLQSDLRTPSVTTNDEAIKKYTIYIPASPNGLNDPFYQNFNK